MNLTQTHHINLISTFSKQFNHGFIVYCHSNLWRPHLLWWSERKLHYLKVRFWNIARSDVGQRVDLYGFHLISPSFSFSRPHCFSWINHHQRCRAGACTRSGGDFHSTCISLLHTGNRKHTEIYFWVCVRSLCSHQTHDGTSVPFAPTKFIQLFVKF